MIEPADPAEELQRVRGIASVEESELPGIDYYVLPIEGCGVQYIRGTWLRDFRDDFSWGGESHRSAEQDFALLVEK
jgi:hypothetical protein